MDNPLRSSFIMGVVRPEDRGSAAGLTSLSRHVPVAVSSDPVRLFDAKLFLERADFHRRLFAIFSRLRFLLHVPRRQTAGGTRGQGANSHRVIMAIFRDLHHDAKLLMASRGIRAFAFSYLNVVFAIYLDRLGYSPVTIGDRLIPSPT